MKRNSYEVIRQGIVLLQEDARRRGGVPDPERVGKLRVLIITFAMLEADKLERQGVPHSEIAKRVIYGYGEYADMVLSQIPDMRASLRSRVMEHAALRGWIPHPTLEDPETLLLPASIEQRRGVRDVSTLLGNTFGECMTPARQSFAGDAAAHQAMFGEPLPAQDAPPQMQDAGKASVAVTKVMQKRLPNTVTCPAAARRMEAHMVSHGIGQAEFAVQAGTTDRTIRSFRAKGKVKRSIFDAIAALMGLTRDDLLKSE